MLIFYLFLGWVALSTIVVSALLYYKRFKEGCVRYDDLAIAFFVVLTGYVSIPTALIILGTSWLFNIDEEATFFHRW